MNERFRQWDTAFVGPWRAITTALGQHGCALALIQVEAVPTYLAIALRPASAAATPMQHPSDLTDCLREQASTTAAWRQRLSDDAMRVLAAHQDWLLVTGQLSADGLASAFDAITDPVNETPPT